MAAEAEIVELLGKVPGRPFRVTVSNVVAVPKGSLMKAGNLRTATITNGDDKFIGIAAAEKVKDDGSLSLALYTHGIFNLTNGAAATFAAGDRVDVNGVNLVSVSDAAGVLKAGVGIALEDCAKSEKAVILVGSGL